jgi:serine/threonine protein kinase
LATDSGEPPYDPRDAWELEANALGDISSLNHAHMISRIAAFTRGQKYYFVFQWADGGCLREFWEKNSDMNLDLDAVLIKEVLIQLLGLADALNALHNYTDTDSWRHGDLKPDNILRFTDSTRLGILQIADLGLAKRHNQATNLRKNATGTKFGTWRYEPPEATTAKLLPRSRLYDIWSMGCILLELIIWLLYGYKGLKQFLDEPIDNPLRETAYYAVDDTGTKAQVHEIALRWMNYLSRDPECSKTTALGGLLQLVREKLLVVALPKPEDNTNVIYCRADAPTFLQQLRKILEHEESGGYFFTGTSRADAPGPPSRRAKLTTPQFLSPDVAWKQKDLITSQRASQSLQSRLAPGVQEQNVSCFLFPHIAE